MRRVLCIYHRIDLDGWMSAAIVRMGIKAGEDELRELGYSYGDDLDALERAIAGYDRIFMVDVSLPVRMMNALQEKLGDDFIWIDHHASAIEDNDSSIKGSRDVTKAACELTWEFLFDKEMPTIVRMLGRYDCFGHKGTEEEQQVLEFQYGARTFIYDVNTAFHYLISDITDRENKVDSHPSSAISLIHQAGVSIYKFLVSRAEQVFKRGFDVLIPEQTDTWPVKFKRFIAFNEERFNPINFGWDYHQDGYDGAMCFHYQNGEWHFSLYNDDGSVDCSAIAKSYGGGGHKGAAGFRTTDLKSVIGKE